MHLCESQHSPAIAMSGETNLCKRCLSIFWKDTNTPIGLEDYTRSDSEDDPEGGGQTRQPEITGKRHTICFIEQIGNSGT